MKFLRRLTLILSVLPLLGGCIYDDLSKCPWVVLTFSYTGDTDDPTMFGKMIDGVTLHCYDASTGWLVESQTIDKASLNRFQGARLNLNPGDYKIVTWANAGSDTDISSATTLAGGRIHNPNFPAGDRIKSNDHLYFGEYDLTVPEDRVVEGDIAHKSAHINVEVYIKGAGSKSDPSRWPIVSMSNLMPQYTMNMAPAQPYATTYHPDFIWEGYGSGIYEGLVSRFQVLRFSDTNDITVSVSSWDGTPMDSVSLQSFMASNSISVDGQNEATVQIMFEFTNMGISIKLPDWADVSTDPEI